MSAVRKATLAEIGRLCRTAMHAFVDDPVMRWMYPEYESYSEGDGATFDWVFRRWLAYDETYTTDDCVALAAFIPPGRPEVEVTNAIPVSEHPADRLARFAAIGTIMAANTPPEPHWYLNLLATHPHWQRQGLGTMVMQPIVERCDAEGLPLYLETETEENVAYYGHLGFTVRDEWDVPLDGPHMWGMIRSPRV